LLTEMLDEIVEQAPRFALRIVSTIADENGAHRERPFRADPRRP
jgi:hypothetical protein